MTEIDTSSPLHGRRRSGIRWWPAAIILAFSAAGWTWIWYIADVHRQTKNLRTTFLVLITVLLLLLWMMLFSRLRWSTRIVIFGGIAALVGFFSIALEIHGVTGDLRPVFKWRWEKRVDLPTISQGPSDKEDTSPPVETPYAYPQIYGPDRNGKLSAPRLASDWQAKPPEQLWRQPIGAAWSGFAVVGRYAVTLEQRDENELASCYHLLTGELLWAHVDKARYQTTIAGEGPRTVPTISDNRVYTLGATGMLNCLDLSNGQRVWSHDIITENDSSAPGWGVSGSPLVTDGMVIVSAGAKNGKSLVAYDAQTGELVWGSGDDDAHYSSPVLASIGGVRQVLIFNRGGVAAHDLNTGQILWEYGWPSGHPHITMPVVLSDDRVLISSGYGTGSQLVQIEQDADGDWSASMIWESKRLKSKFANIIVRDGYIYGLDDGIFVCLELATGQLRWKRGRYGHGQMLLVDDLLLVMTEKGDVILLQLDPDEHRELSRFSIFRDKTWNPPTMVGDVLLVRTDKEAACYRLPTRGK